MVERTLADEIISIVHSEANNNPLPVKCTIHETYPNGLIDVLLENGNILTYLPVIGSPRVGDTGVLLYLDDEKNNQIIITNGGGEVDLSNYIQKSSITGLVKNDGSIDSNDYVTSQELDELIPYNYQITASKYNVDINTDVTITVKITNQLGQPVVGVTVPVLKDNETWQSGTTGVNGTFSLTYTADTWGLVMFSTNSANIQINVKGWETVQTTARFTVKSNGRMVSIHCNQLSNSGNVGTEYTLGTLNTGYRPINPITVPTQSIGDDGSHFGFIRVDTAGVIKLKISRTTYTSSGGRTLYGTVEFAI